MYSVITNNYCIKCQRFTASGCKDIGMRKSEFMARLNSFQKRNRWFKTNITYKVKKHNPEKIEEKEEKLKSKLNCKVDESRRKQL